MRFRKNCIHDRYEEHPCIDGKWVSQGRMMKLKPEERPRLTLCLGGEFLSDGELITVLGRCVHGEMTYEDFRTWADQWLDDHRAQPRESLQ